MKDVKQMSLEELLSIIFKTNYDNGLVRELTAKYFTVRDIHLASLEELKEIKGIGDRKALLLKAVLELGYRIISEPKEEYPTVTCPKDVFDFLYPKLSLLDREYFFILHLNTKNMIVNTETVSIGSLSQTIVHPREVFKNAIKKSAAAIILAHNHPSGNPEVSREDLDVTVRLLEVSDVIGIKILDHVIIGNGSFVSFKEQGLI